jgi:hypothetical protein
LRVLLQLTLEVLKRYIELDSKFLIGWLMKNAGEELSEQLQNLLVKPSLSVACLQPLYMQNTWSRVGA